jgi:hypothetical protein
VIYKEIEATRIIRLKIFPYMPIDQQNIVKAINQLQQHEHKISNNHLPVDEESCNGIFDELWRECIKQNGEIFPVNLD